MAILATLVWFIPVEKDAVQDDDDDDVVDDDDDATPPAVNARLDTTAIAALPFGPLFLVILQMV